LTKTTIKRRSLVCIAALALVTAAGCGGPKLGQVTGTVTVDGTPVTSGTIMFVPDDGKVSVGSIGTDGRFTLTTFSPDDGAMVGAHKVTIHSTKVGAGTMVPASFEEELKGIKGKVLVPGKVEWVVPERYAQLASTDLKATVQPGSQTIDFHLHSK
jgi:hypothetical protein